MSWLKLADNEPVFEAVINGKESETIDPVVRIVVDNGHHQYEFKPEELQSLVVRTMEAKEGSVYDNPDNLREWDNNKKDTSPFNEEDVTKPEKGIDVGPVSTTPGTPEVLAPQIFQ